MNTTIIQVLQILDNSLDPQYSTGVMEKKVRIAQVLVLVAIAEELEKANEMKKKEIEILQANTSL